MNLKKKWVCQSLIVCLLQSCVSNVRTIRPEVEQRSGSHRRSPPSQQKSNAKMVNTTLPAVSGSSSATKPDPWPSPMDLTVEQVLSRQDMGFLEKLESLINISIYSKNINEQEVARNRSIEIVNYRLTAVELEKVAGSSSFGFARGYALYRLAEISIENRDFSQAKSYLNGVIEFVPGSNLDMRAREVLGHLEVSQSLQPRTIGAVLPLSGKNAAMGQRALRGIEMGLGLHLPNSSFKLAIADSEGNQEEARQGVERLVKEDGVVAIIGSLLSKTAPAVATKADEYGVPSIALSQKTGITEVGNTVFRNSLTGKMQVQFLVTNAIQKLGMKRFAIMYPNDPYGIEYANLFWDEVLAQGGTIAAAQTYKPNETDFRFPAQKLVGTYYVEGRYEEFKLRQKELAKASIGAKKSSREHNEEDILPPVIDFDAIFIPDDVKNMGQIAAFLSFTGIKNVKLIGTNLWNTPGVAKRAGNFANSLLFLDSLVLPIGGEGTFSGGLASPANKNPFIIEYKTLFGENPGLIEIQAYDSALILKQLILEGANQRDSLLAALRSSKQISGALGPLSLNDEREFLRPLTMLTLDKSEIVPFIF